MKELSLELAVVHGQKNRSIAPSAHPFFGQSEDAFRGEQ